jgi:hypothetical protein
MQPADILDELKRYESVLEDILSRFTRAQDRNALNLDDNYF